MWGEEAEMWRPWIPKMIWNFFRNNQAPPNEIKFYVNILACSYDSSFRALSQVGSTSGCQIRPSQLLESLVVSVKHTCLMQLKWAKLVFAYTCMCIKMKKEIIKWYKCKNNTYLLFRRSRVYQTDSATPILLAHLRHFSDYILCFLW